MAKDLIYTKRIEVDVDQAVAYNSAVPFDLNLGLDEVAEIVAFDFEVNIFAAVPFEEVWLYSMSMWLSLDPDDLNTTAAEISNDVLVYREVKGWMHSLVAEQEISWIERAGEFITFPPGIYTAVNPVLGNYKNELKSRGECNAAIFYKVLKPTINELAGIVARRR